MLNFRCPIVYLVFLLYGHCSWRFHLCVSSVFFPPFWVQKRTSVQFDCIVDQQKKACYFFIHFFQKKNNRYMTFECLKLTFGQIHIYAQRYLFAVRSMSLVYTCGGQSHMLWSLVGRLFNRSTVCQMIEWTAERHLIMVKNRLVNSRKAINNSLASLLR